MPSLKYWKLYYRFTHFLVKPWVNHPGDHPQPTILLIHVNWVGKAVKNFHVCLYCMEWIKSRLISSNGREYKKTIRRQINLIMWKSYSVAVAESSHHELCFNENMVSTIFHFSGNSCRFIIISLVLRTKWVFSDLFSSSSYTWNVCRLHIHMYINISIMSTHPHYMLFFY